MLDATLKPYSTSALQLTWSTWNEMCDFIKDKLYFGGGVFLDDASKTPLPEGRTSSTIGLWINTPSGKLLCKQDDYIVLMPDGSYSVVTQHLFNMMWDKKPSPIEMERLTKTQKLDSFPYNPNL